jgi:hypothetical protein
MSRRTLRMSLGVLAAAAVLTLGTPAQAAFYIPHFDPEFDGFVLFRIGDACLLNADGTYSSTGACTLDLMSADVFDTENTETHYTSGFQGNVGFQVVIAGNELTQLSTSDPILESCFGEFCTFADLQFFTGCGFPIDDSCLPLATLAFDSTVLSAGYTLIRQTDGVPEPGTLGLIFGAVGAAWLARRRKAAA